MALTIGDGPNRGRSAPPPGRSTPLPKPKPGGASDRLAREFADAIVQRNSARSSRTPDRFTYPILGSLFGKDKAGYDLPDKPVKHDFVPKTNFAPRAADDGRTLDEATAEVWGNLANEGAAGEIKRRAGGDTSDPAQQRAQIVQNVADKYNVQARLGRKDQARMDREKLDRSEVAEELTMAQWNKMTPMQQAAAQANADLAAAIARDFKDQSKHGNSPTADGGNERFAAYQNRVRELFGEGELSSGTGFKGLEYAPNTIAFLDKRGIGKEDLAGTSFDDLISGDALIEAETIDNLNQPTANDARARNVTFAKNIAAGQLQYQEDMAAQLKRGKQLLTSLTGRDTNAGAHTSYGAVGMPGHAKMTVVRPELVTQIDKYMEALARPDIPTEDALASIRADLVEFGASQEETAQIWDNMIERTRGATTGEAKWFDDVDFTMRDPLEVSTALGVPALKRRAVQ